MKYGKSGIRLGFGYFVSCAVSGLLFGQPYSLEPVTAEWVPMAEAYADARTAPLGVIERIVAGANGDIYLSCFDLRRVFRLTAAGRLEVWAGSGKLPVVGWGAEREAKAAELEMPAGLAWDPAGRLYISEPGRIYGVGPDRRISAVAGNGRIRPLADEMPSREVSAHPAGQIAMSPGGDLLFYDSRAFAIREVGRDGKMHTFAGEEPNSAPPAMHPRVVLRVPYTRSLSVDSKGSVWYATDQELHRLDYRSGRKYEGVPLKVLPNCVVEGLAHSTSGALAVACEAAGELWVYPGWEAKPRVLRRHAKTVAFDADGALWFAEANRLYRMEIGGEPRHMAGSGNFGDGGPASEAWLARPHSMVQDADGSLIIADRNHNMVRRVRVDGRIEAVAGNGEGGLTGDGGPAREARIFEPMGVAVKDGVISILTLNPTSIRQVDQKGIIRTIFQDSSLHLPTSLIVDAEGRLVLGFESGGRIFRLERDGRLELIAGTGHLSSLGLTGRATSTPLWRVSALAQAADGSLLFTQAPTSNFLRRITMAGEIENLAGSAERREPLGEDPAPGLTVRLEEPLGVAELPGEGTLVATAFRLLLRRPDGMLAVYANSRDMNEGFAGIVVDESKNVYVLDYTGGVLRVARRSGGLAASSHRMARKALTTRKNEEARVDFGKAWPFGLAVVLAAVPFAFRRWRYRRQKARLLRGVDSNLSAVFSPPGGGASPRGAVAGVLEGRYRIVECVANGGSAVVYRAEDLRNPARMVAVKVFDLPDEDPVAVQRRLLRECVASSRVRHVSVAPMLDVGMTAEGQPFLVMEFVEGESLRALLRRDVMDRGVAVRLLGELSDAVAATHAQGVLHLDIKPENLMVRAENGRLVLIDFGLAAVAEAGALATHMSSVGGTLDYMAPEQLLGHVSAGADIYACGAVALEMLAGKRVAELELPPNNQDLALTAARVRAAVTGVREEAVVVLARMLSLRPEERPAGLAELVRALG